MRLALLRALAPEVHEWSMRGVCTNDCCARIPHDFRFPQRAGMNACQRLSRTYSQVSQTHIRWRPSQFWLEGLEAIAIRLEAIASRLEAIVSRLEAIASRLEAIASMFEAF